MEPLLDGQGPRWCSAGLPTAARQLRWRTTYHQFDTANQATAVVQLSIRDHDLSRFEQRKQEVQDAVAAVRALHPRAVVDVEVTDVYGNIADAVTEGNRAATDLMLRALEELGIPARPTVMRGGTDGSWLSRQGILTPNLFTGAHNFHSAQEFLPLSSFERSHAVVRELVRLVAEGS